MHAHCRTAFFSFDTGRNYSSADCHLENQGIESVTFLTDKKFKMTLAERFTQVMDSIPWVRCASGNVFALIDESAAD